MQGENIREEERKKVGEEVQGRGDTARKMRSRKEATERSRKRRSKRVLWASNREGVGGPKRDWQRLSSTPPRSLIP